MIKIVVVVREAGRLKPDYSLNFEVPELPREGEYISIQRPDKAEPYGEDMIVSKVWWRLRHPETGMHTEAEHEKTGGVIEIFVECDPAIGPYSSDQWRRVLQAAVSSGKAEEFKVARFSVGESELGPQKPKAKKGK
jgi:hypothetical protein